jgi:hypothetical protein
MMFEAFGFMQERILHCRNVSQLPSGGYCFGSARPATSEPSRIFAHRFMGNANKIVSGYRLDTMSPFIGRATEDV